MDCLIDEAVLHGTGYGLDGPVGQPIIGIP